MRMYLMSISFLLLLSINCSNPRKDAEEHLRLGIIYRDSTKYKDALNEFQLAYRADSTLLDALYLSALIKKDIRDYDAAINDLMILLEKKYKPDSVNYQIGSNYFSKALQLKNNHLYENAIKALDNCINIEPDMIKAYHLKVLAQYNSSKYNEAMITLNTLISLDSTDYEYYIIRGDLKSTLGYPEGGLLDLNKVIESNIKDSSIIALAYQRRGIWYQNKNLLAKSLNDLTRAIEMDSTNSLFYITRGNVYLELYNDSLACVDFRKAADQGYLPAYDYLKKNCK